MCSAAVRPPTSNADSNSSVLTVRSEAIARAVSHDVARKPLPFRFDQGAGQLLQLLPGEQAGPGLGDLPRIRFRLNHYWSAQRGDSGTAP